MKISQMASHKEQDGIMNIKEAFQIIQKNCELMLISKGPHGIRYQFGFKDNLDGPERKCIQGKTQEEIKNSFILFAKELKNNAMSLKYRNKKCTWQLHGKLIKFDSVKEKRYAFYLEALKQKGYIQSWDREKKFNLIVNGQKICSHKPDFYVILKDGTKQVHEIKSRPTKTNAWIKTRKLFIALYPDIKYIVID